MKNRLQLLMTMTSKRPLKEDAINDVDVDWNVVIFVNDTVTHLIEITLAK